MRKLSNNQMELLLTLSKKYKNGGIHHPVDAYNLKTINSLENRKLVYTYHHHLFLHDAVGLTEEGRKLVKELMDVTV